MEFFVLKGNCLEGVFREFYFLIHSFVFSREFIYPTKKKLIENDFSKLLIEEKERYNLIITGDDLFSSSGGF